MGMFKLHSKYKPMGDQPEAIRQLVNGVNRGEQFQTLLGVTGSGKTFTMANIIAQTDRPTLIFSHNKTLAAQLYGEFKQYFPENAVEFFISYYDYYQPEAYVPTTDTYIAKDSSRNEEIDRLRLKTTASLMSRRDVIIIASVSCIYGIGSPDDYGNMMVLLKKGEEIARQEIFGKLVDIQYTRNDMSRERGTFRVKGDVIEIYPAYEKYAVRLDTFGDEIEAINYIDVTTGEVLDEVDQVLIFPASHFVTTEEKMKIAIERIREELAEQLELFRKQNKLLEAQRIEQRTNFDIEMMQEIGFCNGIENYSRHITGRNAGDPGFTLLDFFPDDFLMFVDESHQTLPQIRGMYFGDRSRKETLVDYGFRLPSALDNRPLKFDEFMQHINQIIFVSATPAALEIELSKGEVVEQVIRPTGLIDPEIEVRPTKGQIDDLIEEIRVRIEKGERVLVLTLTKRMSEDLTDYLKGMGIKVQYIHSEIDALERVDLLRNLRLAEHDVLVGINLLREGLDLPEVSLVAILDADKEGFLRSEVSLLQIAGRAARNSNGLVIMYADKITKAMKTTIDETARRREKQVEYNTEHGVTPTTVYKTVDEIMQATAVADVRGRYKTKGETNNFEMPDEFSALELIDRLEKEMKTAAASLEFEKAAQIRDEILKLKGKIGK
ncbi:MAG: excinuclease ABC subunit UvrB [Calditrichia bacterium]|nr:excinuclease ABC subunit UvrB [Calditrichota bacterium]MCB0267871.1 excinuclease ABC subunit UvrB [Calditrichota bacterium]MCB0285600.1 excinuclease ABC subunit UvrB [Calditrichota bacterium]MCB9068609.1 excinuclease ABC subunit UvrB [Calditrichia bacterium]